MDLILIALGSLLMALLVNALADSLPYGRLPSLPSYRDGSRRIIVVWLVIAALMLTAHLFGASSLLMHIYAALFVLLALADIEHRQILLAPLLALAGLALFDAAIITDTSPNLAASLAGGLAGGGAFAALYCGGMLYSRLSGAGPALGFGDVCLMAVAGLLLGFPNSLIAMLVAIISAGCFALSMLASLRLRGLPYRRHSSMAYAPFILAATYLGLLFDSQFSRFFAALWD